MSLIDKKFLKEILLYVEIKKIKVNINIRGIGTFKHIINNYYLFNLYISDTLKN